MKRTAFWQYHDGLFESDLMASEATLNTIAKAAGLNVEQWELTRESEAVRARIRNDVQLGNDLGVDATPAVFLNGRRVREFGFTRLDILVRHEVGEAD